MNENQLTPQAQKLVDQFKLILAASPKVQQRALQTLNEQVERMETGEDKDFCAKYRDIVAEAIEEVKSE